MDPVGGPSKSSKDDAESASSSKETLSTDNIKKPPTKLKPTRKGVENAKQKLRAFSIQKKNAVSPIVAAKTTTSSSTATVIIGKLAGVKVTPKVEPDPDLKKPPKPPKPGNSRRAIQDSYTELQKRTLAEIEDMKRKMELVDLGIPLGLICPTSTSEKAMPTKAMPPIKSFLDPAKVDELIREAKKAKQEGREFKFDYQKLLPDYDNPFQKKKEDSNVEKERRSERRRSESEREGDKDRRWSEKYDVKRHDYKKDSKYKDIRDRKYDESQRYNSDEKETDVNLNDYLVCDSWSLENDDKNSTSSPKVLDKPSTSTQALLTSIDDLKIPLPPEPPISKKNYSLKSNAADSPKREAIKIAKLQPVIDSFEYEIDPNEDGILDTLEEVSEFGKYGQQTKTKSRSYYDSPAKIDYEQDNAKDSIDGLDDTFLESVINEIKQEQLSDEESQDRGLVEYEMSPNRESPEGSNNRSSVTPEIDNRSMSLSQRSDYSDGYKSTDSYKSVDTIESGYKSVESGYKSVESGCKSVKSGYKSAEREYKSVERFRLSVEKELDEALEANMSKTTVDSLETWSFVLKICQPLLFRHDKNKCYKETRTSPKLWYAANPKTCSCVQDRGVVYDELEMCKMTLVDRVYGCDQIPEDACPKSRRWYPRTGLCPAEAAPLPLANEWEADDSQPPEPSDAGSACATPLRSDEMSLDREYQRFMEAVWPDVIESKNSETPRSTTPVRQESRKKKKEDVEKEEEKKPKKIKLSSECWSQESEVEEEDKSKKQKMEKQKAKSRKRKHSTSTLSSSASNTDDETRKKRKLLKKKAIKKTKSKSAKSRRMGRKILKKLKEKQKKKIKEKVLDDGDSDKKTEKRSKKKKQQKLKKKELKKKKNVKSSSDSSSSDSSDDSDRRSRKSKKKRLELKKKAKKLRKQSTSESQGYEEELFDVNILNNIKTERLTDDERVGKHKMMQFSPRRQKPREIINVKELQNDFVGNIHIKQEVEDVPPPKEDVPPPKEDVPPPKEDVHPPKEDVPPTKEDVPPPKEAVPLPKEDVPQPKESPKEVSKVPAIEDPWSRCDGAKDIELLKVSPRPIKTQDIPAPVASSAAIPQPDESNMSQASSQESVCSVSVKDAPIFYEKDESHLRPSSQNSNYSFKDVINASQNNLYQKEIKIITKSQNLLYDKEIEINVDPSLYGKEIETISNQSGYGKINASQTCYDKVSAGQSEYDKTFAPKNKYDKRLDATIANRTDFDTTSSSQSGYNKKNSPNQGEYDKNSAIQTNYDKRLEMTATSDNTSASPSSYSKKNFTNQGEYDKVSAAQSNYDKSLDVLSANSHNDYDKISASQSAYSKIPAEYDKASAAQIDYDKTSASQSGYNENSNSMSQSEYDKMSASQNDYNKVIEVTTNENSLYAKELEMETECGDKYGDYGAANYEMYEQMAMAYQSDVASQQRAGGQSGAAAGGEGACQRIETVVGARAHGEIKCDWRAGDAPATPHRAQRPSRWGLKPGEVNIVLTGGGSQLPQPDAPAPEPVYRIQSLANRSDNSTGYDEAYMDMYGASDRLQYGDCFSDDVDLPTGAFSLTHPHIIPNASGNCRVSPNIVPVSAAPSGASEAKTSSLDDRINRALRETVLGGIANEIDGDKASSDTGKLTGAPARAVKRVSFADGYKPGQDSDVEEPPSKKRKRSRRVGCAWPCPASHPDHVPLWDALPPPPPPPGSPPPPRRAAPAVHLLRHAAPALLPMPPPIGRAKFDPLPGFMPPEPPPGIITLQ